MIEIIDGVCQECGVIPERPGVHLEWHVRLARSLAEAYRMAEHADVFTRVIG